MPRHQLDLVQCMKQPGIHTGKVCNKCDGKCPMCESMVHPYRLVRVCDECAAVSGDKCIICGTRSDDLVDSYYCYECCQLEKDRIGCPRIVNVGSTRAAAYFDKNRR